MAETKEYSALKISNDDDSITTITLSKPEIHNAFNEQLIAELSDCFKVLGNKSDVRVIVLTGEGKSFCAGADIKWMRSMVDFSKEENIEDSTKLANMFKIVNECPKPVIGKINGHAIGGGAGLVASCDIAVASESAKFSFSEVKLGITPSVISPYVLAKIGPGNARKLFITGERFDAGTALQIGLVHRVVPPDGLEQAVFESAQMLLDNGPMAMDEVKQLIYEWADSDSEAFRKYTINRIAELRVSKEGREGLAAFLEKRKPEWRR